MSVVIHDQAGIHAAARSTARRFSSMKAEVRASFPVGTRDRVDTRTQIPRCQPVHIYTLGRFGVLVEGSPPPRTRKAPHRLLELLQAIVALGGYAVPVSQLIDHLWPHSEGDRAHATFVKSLKRLRAYLCVDRLVHLEHGTVTLNPERCWVDVWEFERHCTRSEQGSRHKNSPSRQSGYEDALALYQGPFLPAQGEKAWVIPTRERLRRIFVRGVARLSDHSREEGRIEQAIAWLDRGLRLDPLAEPLYVPLMALLLTDGRRTEAQRLYHECVKVYARDLGQRPPSAMTRLYKRDLQ
jgi:LuxR family maltose regulon positive regulatory protein